MAKKLTLKSLRATAVQKRDTTIIVNLVERLVMVLARVEAKQSS